MNAGVILTHWTIRCALAGMLAVWIARASGVVSTTSAARWRVIWTLSWMAFVAHVVAAFAYYHHWDHWHAVADTARKTEQLIGWSFGEGIYFSYLFLLLWGVDVVCWWMAVDADAYLHPETPIKTRFSMAALCMPNQLLQLYLAFIAFNGAVIFESGYVRVAGIAGSLAWCAAVIYRQVRARAPIDSSVEQASP